MDRNAPSFFRQGPSANARIVFFALLAIIVLITDARWNALAGVRQGIGNVLYPLQRTMLLPRDAWNLAQEYAKNVHELRSENDELKRDQALHSLEIHQTEQLVAENRRLRELAGARERAPVKSVLTQILYETQDAFSRKLVLDKGIDDGVRIGQPVIDPKGLVGQVTRVFQFSSEMTLITDPAMTVPVQVERSSLHSVAFGSSRTGSLELRYLASNVDLRKGDRISTSGLDALYPTGLPIGEIVEIERGGGNDLMRAIIKPAAQVASNGMMVVLQVDTSTIPAMPNPDATEAPRRKARH